MSVTSILKSIASFVKGLLPWAKNAIVVGREVTNEIKGIVDNPSWDFVVSLTSTRLDDAGLAILRTFLAEALKAMNLADKEISRADAIGVVFKQASQAIAAIEIPEVRASVLNAIAAVVSTKYAEIQGNVLPIESALAATPASYVHPELTA